MELLDERRISFIELARRENVDLSTVWRWALRGARGVKLESMAVGGRRYTTIEAVERFTARCTAAVNGESDRRNERQHHRAIQHAERELEGRGI
jgi:hypothetical protein